MNPMQNVTSTFTTTVQQNRAIIESRFIADHCACTTASSQSSLLLDSPVRTGDVISVKLCCRPSVQLLVGRKPERMDEAWSKTSKIRGFAACRQVS